MKKLLLSCVSLIILIAISIYGMKVFFPNYYKNAFLGNMPFMKDFVQKEFKTYTSITGIKDTMKLVTAKQQLDFINIMDGKDGRYIEVATYEVKAGIDFEKTSDSSANSPKVQILSSNKINSNVIRREADISNAQFYTECIKPVNLAYEEKSKDYAVELGILKNAQKNAEEILNNIFGFEIENKTAENQDFQYKSVIEFANIPLQFEISTDYFEEHDMKIVNLPQNQFNRDAVVFESAKNGDWKIRVGDSGRQFYKKFDDFYKNVFETNTDSNNDGKDKVEIFRYFDPLYPKESEVLSYASDNFKTFFILNNGRIYYIDAECSNEQELLDKLSPITVYLASSVRKINDKKIDSAKDYQKYIENFFDAAESLRNNDDRNSLTAKTESLIKSQKNESEINSLSSAEKLFKAICDIKNLNRQSNENNTEGKLSIVQKTDDEELNDIAELIIGLSISEKDYESESVREKAILTATKLNEKIKKNDYVNLALHQYLESYFLQNAAKFKLSPSDRKRYEDDLNSGEIVIASRPLIALKSDSERNKYFYDLFRNRLSMSHFFVDTASRIDDSLKLSKRGNLTFAYFNIPKTKEMTDGEVLAKITKKNNGHEIDNAFVLVFNQREWDFGDFGGDDDIHALVFDEATLRLFTNIGSQNVTEIATTAITDLAKKFLRIDGSPEFFYYGDWKKLQVSPENVRISGQNFGTNKITQRGKLDYRHTNDYAEKSTIALVIEDLQHAYSSDDENFYHNTLKENLNYQLQHYVYQKIFRPSPRFIIDTRKDEKKRYNW